MRKKLIDRIEAEFDRRCVDTMQYHKLLKCLWPDWRSHNRPNRGGPPGCAMALSRCIRENRVHIDYQGGSVMASIVYRPSLTRRMANTGDSDA